MHYEVHHALETIPRHLILDVEHHENLYNSCQASNGCPESELNEISQIVFSYAVVCKRAMVVHFIGTMFTSATVVDMPSVPDHATFEASIINIIYLTIF